MTRMVAPVSALTWRSQSAEPHQRRHQEAALLVEDRLEVVVGVDVVRVRGAEVERALEQHLPGSRPGAWAARRRGRRVRSVPCAGRRGERAHPGPRPRRVDRSPGGYGTPRSSQWLYLKPGDSSRQSTLKRSGPLTVWTSVSDFSQRLDRAGHRRPVVLRAEDRARSRAGPARRSAAGPGPSRRRGP